MARTAEAGTATSIPTFRLYEDNRGESEADGDFVHIETISARAGLHNWEIRPHRHEALHQFLVLLEGRGRVDAEGRIERFSAPALIAVPRGLVHGFRFGPDAEGFVLTVANRFLERCLQRDPEPVARPEQVMALDLEAGGELSLLRAAFEFLNAELPDRRPGQVRAVAACVEFILVVLTRRWEEGRRNSPPSPARALVDRFQALVNSHAIEGWSIPRYAEALSVSVEQLKRSCRVVAGCSPLTLAHHRLLSEAKRSLSYTCMTVQEVGFSLGFSDPAYFTRFFVQREGCPPSRFRQRIFDRRLETRG